MRFDGIGPVPDGQSLDRTGPSGSSSAKGGASQAKAVADQTQLSSSQSRVQDLKAELTGLPDVRQERVAALQQAIGNGSFHPSDQQLADAILGDFFGPVTTGNQ
jgi:flagellar biosynthesis anti-sigma factor FlgM